jgi:hypothetical protein
MLNSDFKIWLDKVDKQVYFKTSFHLSDLTDQDYWMNYENGTSIESMCKIVIEDLEGYCGLLGCQVSF